MSFLGKLGRIVMSVVRTLQPLQELFAIHVVFANGILGAFRQFERLGGAIDPSVRRLGQEVCKECGHYLDQSGFQLLCLPSAMGNGDVFRYVWRHRASSTNFWQLMALAVTHFDYLQDYDMIVSLQQITVAGHMPPLAPVIESVNSKPTLRLRNFSRVWPKNTAIFTRQGY